MLRFPTDAPHTVLDAAVLAAMSPSTYQPGGIDVDDLVRDMLLEDFMVIGRHPEMQNAYDLERAGTGIFYRVPWLVNAFGLSRLSQMSAVEIGCGSGVKGLPWSRLFKSYLGVDLNPDHIERARALRNELSRTTAEFVCENASAVASDPSKFGLDKIDLLILYAVLEHLTVSERREILELASAVIGDGGYVVVCETPNRLLPFDSHSSELHFYQSLPPELAIAYLERSPMASARESVSDELSYFRFGNALSYHEFDLWLHDGNERAPEIVADGWSPWAMHDQPVRCDETSLANYLQANHLAPPLFGRYWLDGIFGGAHGLMAQVSCEAPGFIPTGDLPSVRYEDFVSPTQVVIKAGDELACGPAKGPRALVIDLERSSGRLEVLGKDGRTLWGCSVDELADSRFPRWHVQCVVDLSALEDWDHPLTLKADHGAYFGPGFVTT
jgi:hypothetical protein